MFFPKWILSCAIALLLAGISNAQQQQPPPTTGPASAPARVQSTSEMKSLLADLANRDAALRERARSTLMGLERNQLDEFRTVIEQSRPLLPAQLGSLREIVMHVYLAGVPYEAAVPATGFLGVHLSDIQVDASDDPNNPRFVNGAVIVGRVKGFCGYRVFEDGDVVLAVAERPQAEFGGNRSLIDYILQQAPGATVQLRVLRQGRMVPVSVKLDARPVLSESVKSIEIFQSPREQKADAFWEREFAPLLEERTS